MPSSKRRFSPFRSLCRVTILKDFALEPHHSFLIRSLNLERDIISDKKKKEKRKKPTLHRSKIQVQGDIYYSWFVWSFTCIYKSQLSPNLGISSILKTTRKISREAPKSFRLNLLQVTSNASQANPFFEVFLISTYKNAASLLHEELLVVLTLTFSRTREEKNIQATVRVR